MQKNHAENPTCGFSPMHPSDRAFKIRLESGLKMVTVTSGAPFPYSVTQIERPQPRIFFPAHEFLPELIKVPQFVVMSNDLAEFVEQCFDFSVRESYIVETLKPSIKKRMDEADRYYSRIHLQEEAAVKWGELMTDIVIVLQHEWRKGKSLYVIPLKENENDIFENARAGDAHFVLRLNWHIT